MPVETERKFLVANDEWCSSVKESHAFLQGYLAESKGASVRVRAIDDREAVITIKSTAPGISRAEYEYAIPIEHARELLTLCSSNVLEKRRHIVVDNGNRWEVDVYSGRHQGLVMAELELTDVDQVFAKPGWLGEEVSNDPQYFNSALARETAPPRR